MSDLWEKRREIYSGDFVKFIAKYLGYLRKILQWHCSIAEDWGSVQKRIHFLLYKIYILLKGKLNLEREID